MGILIRVTTSAINRRGASCPEHRRAQCRINAGRSVLQLQQRAGCMVRVR